MAEQSSQGPTADTPRSQLLIRSPTRNCTPASGLLGDERIPAIKSAFDNDTQGHHFDTRLLADFASEQNPMKVVREHEYLLTVEIITANLASMQAVTQQLKSFNVLITEQYNRENGEPIDPAITQTLRDELINSSCGLRGRAKKSLFGVNKLGLRYSTPSGPLTMREQTVAMYCLLDDLLRVTRPTVVSAATCLPRLTDAQVLTTALVAARFFGGNLTLGRHYMEQHRRHKQLDKSSFTRRLHALADTLWSLFATCGQALKKLHLDGRYVIDSFPVAVCQNIRIPRAKVLQGEAYRGRTASNRQWFYRVKVQVITTSDRVPVEFYVHAGREADITGLRGMALDLPEGSTLYCDNAYTDYVLEDIWAEATDSQQQTARKANSKRPNSPAQRFLLQHFNKRIETTFSQLTARFPKHIHAVTPAGFVLKIALSIFVHTLDQTGY